MAKACDDYFLDGTPDLIANCTALAVCSAQPANHAGVAAVTLASTTLAGGDFSKANGDSSGRKVTVAQKSAISITASGDATHVVHDTGTYIYVTTCTTQTLTSGGTVTVPAHKMEVADPT